MRFNIKGEYFYQDRTLKSVDFFNCEFNDEDVSIYEVFRIDQSIPLFIEDHLARLNNSFEVAGKSNWKKKAQLISAIRTLISANTIDDGIIKLDFRFHKNGDKQFQAYFLQSNFPGKNQIDEGVIVCYQKAIRTKPTAKIYNSEVRGSANVILEDEHIYETLLVNDKDQITEGSRSNLFFIKDNYLITAPDQVVLSGVVRKKILFLANELKIPIKYEALKMNDVSKMEAAFISGTTPRVLGLKQVENTTLNAKHHLILQLRAALNNQIEQLKNHYH